MRIEDHYEPTYRSDVIEKIARCIKKGYSSTVVSIRGAGLGPLFKFLRLHPYTTSHYLKGENVSFSWINLEELLNKDQKSIFKEILRDLRATLVTNVVEKNEYIEKQFNLGLSSEDDQEVLYYIKNLLQVAHEADMKFVVLFQEFDDLAKGDPSFLNTLFSLHQTFKPTIVFVFGVHTFPNRLRDGNPTKFDYIFQEYVTMTPYTKEAYMAHYPTHFGEEGLHLSSEQLEIMYDYTGGFASYLRYFGNKLSPDDLTDIGGAIEKYKDEPHLQLRTRQVLVDLLPEEVATLKQIARGGKASGDLKSLKELGVLNDKGEIFSKIFASHILVNDKDASGIKIDSETKKAYVDNVEVFFYLSPTEFKFLEYLYKNKGSVCDREQVIEYAWGGNPEGVSDEAVDQLVSRLRSKLATHTGRRDLVTTVRGHGFSLN